MTITYYRNLPALPTREAVVAEVERLRAKAARGELHVDGWRVSVEVPVDVAMDMAADAAAKLERQARELRECAERWR